MSFPSLRLILAVVPLRIPIRSGTDPNPYRKKSADANQAVLQIPIVLFPGASVVNRKFNQQQPWRKLDEKATLRPF